MRKGNFDRFHEDMKNISEDIKRIARVNNGRQTIDNRKYLRYCILMLLIITLLLSGVRMMPAIMIVILICILEITNV